MRDPYAVLGVKRDADANEIKTAWRAIAKKIHPDQNRADPNAARRFAEAGEAYEVLKDPKKRSRYDLLTQSGRQEATIQQQREAQREAEAKRRAAEENARKVMEEIARAEAERARKAAAEGQPAADRSAKAQGASQPNGEKPGNGQQSASQNGQQAYAAAGEAEQKAGADTHGAESPEAVIDRIFGAQPQFTVSGEQTNYGASAGYEQPEPERSGAPSGSANSGLPLPLAAFEAITSFIRRLTGGTQAERAPDQFAEARISIEDMLKENWVTVALPEGRDLRFRLDPGVTDGQVVRLKGQGYKVPGLIRGDAVVTLRVEPSALFRVSGHDIHTVLPVTLEDAVLGCSAEVQSPTGPVQVDVPQWSGSDQVIRVPGLGLLDGKGGRGDLVAEIRILLWEKPDAKVTDLMRAMREGLYL